MTDYGWALMSIGALALLISIVTICVELWRQHSNAKRTPPASAFEESHTKEIATLRAHLEWLRREHEGEWVAIHGDKILGVGKRSDLLDQFYKLENQPLLVTLIGREGKAHPSESSAT